MAKKCAYRKKNGERCDADAQIGKSLCVFHDPARASEGRRARRAGGITRSRLAVVLPRDTPDHPLGRTTDVSILLADSINQLRRGQMDKIMRLHSITNTIENGFVYLPTGADWLSAYLHELTTFPNGKHDDQADSTSQALDWAKANHHTYPLFEYYRRQELRYQLGLDPDYRFTQCDEDEEIIAVHEQTGERICGMATIGSVATLENLYDF